MRAEWWRETQEGWLRELPIVDLAEACADVEAMRAGAEAAPDNVLSRLMGAEIVIGRDAARARAVVLLYGVAELERMARRPDRTYFVDAVAIGFDSRNPGDVEAVMAMCTATKGRCEYGERETELLDLSDQMDASE